MNNKIKIIEVSKSFYVTVNTNFNSINQGTTITFQVQLPEGEELSLEEDNELFMKVYKATMSNLSLLAEVDKIAAAIIQGREMDMEELKKIHDRRLENAKLKKELNSIDYTDSMPGYKKPVINKVVK